MPEQTSNALSRPDAAGYIGVSPHTLATWATRGGGPPFCRVGRRCVYLRGDLDAFLAARRVTSTAATSEAEAAAAMAAAPTAANARAANTAPTAPPRRDRQAAASRSKGRSPKRGR